MSPKSTVAIVHAPFDASNGAETPFGRRWGGDVATLTPDHLAAIKTGKTLALDVLSEYVLFVCAEAHPHPGPLPGGEGEKKRPTRRKGGRNG